MKKINYNTLIKEFVQRVKESEFYCKWFHKREKLHHAFVDVVNGQSVFGYGCECGNHFLTQSVFNRRWAYRVKINK